jgi:hypothetical protein
MPLNITSLSSHQKSFLSNAQQALAPTASPQTIETANDHALQQATQASLQHDDGLTAAQKFARDTGHAGLIDEANKAAIDEAIEASRRWSGQEATTVRTFIPTTEFAAHSGLVATLKNWLSKHGFIVKPNSGNQNNCLLISMLQHVTGDYSPNSKALSKAAEQYKRMIADWSNGKEKTSSSLFSDDKLTELIVEQINQDYFGERRDRYIQFKFITASLDGEPAERYIGNGPKIEGILDGGGHYEAFVKRPDVR